MKNQALSLLAASALAITSGGVLAQSVNNTQNAAAASPIIAVPLTSTPPVQAGRYTGPSAVVLTTVKQLLASGKDDQYARLQGKIVSHEAGENYTFSDDSGSMPVEISSKRFPPGQSISAEQRVELSGKLDKEWRTTEFDVKNIRLLP